jgi:hypothetical protein
VARCHLLGILQKKIVYPPLANCTDDIEYECVHEHAVKITLLMTVSEHSNG